MQQRLIRANHERGPLDAPNLLAIHVLFLQHVKLLAHFLVHIGKQRVRQLVFGAKFGLLLGRVAADAQHHRPSRLQFRERIAEAAGLNGAARSIRFGVKEEDDRLAGVIRQAHGLILVRLQGKIGNFLD